MVAGINNVNPTACSLLPLLGCTTPLSEVAQLDPFPAEYKDGQTVADLCPCGTCSPTRNSKLLLYFLTKIF